MSLLPSRPDPAQSEDAEPRVIDVDSDDADDVLAALSSSTARELLTELHERPGPPSELAERVDTSVQNAQYHLEKLDKAGAIEVVDTAYSEKGREMDVYAPADEPLVIYVGDEEKGSALRTALSRLLGAVALLAAASLAVQGLVGDGLPWEFGGDSAPDGDGAAPAGNGNGAGGNGNGAPAGDDAASTPDGPGIQGDPESTPTPDVTETVEATPTPTPESTPSPETVETATDAAASLPPGLLFFAGGAFALVVVAAALWLRG